MERCKWIHIRVSETERLAWQAIAQANNLTLADLIRQLLGDNKPVRRPAKRRARVCQQVDPALLRELARIGNNLNQLARWSNTYKNSIEAVTVCAQLLVIQRQLAELKSQTKHYRSLKEPVEIHASTAAMETRDAN